MRTIVCSRSWILLADKATKRLPSRHSIPTLQLLTPTRHLKHQDHSFTTTTIDGTSNPPVKPKKKKIYLHVGPSGDSWIGDAIFAAKHNQPGYVKSIPLCNSDNLIGKDATAEINEDMTSLLIDVLDEHPEWAQEIYDTECFPETLQHHLKSLYEEENS